MIMGLMNLARGAGCDLASDLEKKLATIVYRIKRRGPKLSMSCEGRIELIHLSGAVFLGRSHKGWIIFKRVDNMNLTRTVNYEWIHNPPQGDVFYYSTLKDVLRDASDSTDGFIYRGYNKETVDAGVPVPPSES